MSLYLQFESMLAIFILGILFGCCFDTYLRLVRKYKRNRIRIFISDIFFFIGYGFLFFYLIYLVNEGTVRFYMFLANLLGFSVYQVLLQKYFLNFLEFSLRFMLKLYMIVRKLLQFFFIEPIRYILKLLVLFVMIMCKVILFLLRPVQFLLYHSIWKHLPFSFRDKTQKWIQMLPEKKNEWLHWLKQ
ncbi:spore cortex biosynthesis protein YabQ [Massilibacterium senegalense]|uniref:spore cortex biosynthesis protein YabQ n=1 Tax=Massilibacterium senegalense TaxID=1632858 RepID=UPI0007839B63